jgi:nitroreductase
MEMDMDTDADAKDALGFIFGRRSIREFQAEQVSDADVRTLLESAMAAPSAVAKDPWRFVVVRDRQMLNRIAQGLPNGQLLASAPMGIVVGGDLTAAHDRQLSYLLQDCSAAIQNLLLAAHILKLGACWLGVHPRESRVALLRSLLGMPNHFIPVAAIALGRPAETKEARTRYNPDYVRQERW